AGRHGDRRVQGRVLEPDRLPSRSRAGESVKRFWLGCVALLTALAHASLVLADPNVVLRPMAVSWLGHVPVLSFSAADFIDAGVREKLGSGLPQRIVTRVYAYPEHGGDEPITVAALSCRVVYDLWEG